MKIKAAVPFDNILKEDLRNPKIKEAYDEETFISEVALQIVKLREANKISQIDFAKRLHTSQQTISRLENADQNLTLKTIFKIGKVLHKKPQLKFV